MKTIVEQSNDVTGGGVASLSKLNVKTGSHLV